MTKKQTGKGNARNEQGRKQKEGVKTKEATPKKVYKNAAGKVIYRQSSDKVGDVLVNQAGVKYKIAGERFAPPKGNPGDVPVRVLKLKPYGLKNKSDFVMTSIEMNDQTVKYCREHKIFRRERPEAVKKTPQKNAARTKKSRK